MTVLCESVSGGWNEEITDDREDGDEPLTPPPGIGTFAWSVPVFVAVNGCFPLDCSALCETDVEQTDKVYALRPDRILAYP